MNLDDKKEVEAFLNSLETEEAKVMTKMSFDLLRIMIDVHIKPCFVENRKHTEEFLKMPLFDSKEDFEETKKHIINFEEANYLNLGLQFFVNMRSEEHGGISKQKILDSVSKALDFRTNK